MNLYFTTEPYIYFHSSLVLTNSEHHINKMLMKPLLELLDHFKKAVQIFFTFAYTKKHSSSLIHLGSLMTIPIPKGSELKFDMIAAVIRTLKETECTRECDNCENMDGYEKLEITDTTEFLMLHLLICDEQEQKST